MDGLEAVTEDWHAKVCLLGVSMHVHVQYCVKYCIKCNASTQVIWKRLYKGTSGSDGGTMCQLKKLINRRNVVKDPSKSVAPCEEFFLLVVETHVLAAAMHLFQMTSLDDAPSSTYFPKGSEDLGSLERRRVLMQALKVMMKRYVDLTVTYDSKPQSKDDHVRAYACEIISLGLLLMEFNDAI